MNQKIRFRKRNVLAVDDIPANLLALKAVLSRDHNLIFGHSGEEAISILQSRDDIDIILMDIQMPIMDGFEAATSIKQMENCRDIPIIFITAIYNEEPFIKKGYEIGAIDYFSKPFDPEILRMKVDIYSSFKQRDRFLKERERQFFESEEVLRAGRKLSSVLESLPVGVLIADINGRICQTNEVVSKICKSEKSTDSNLYGEVLNWWSRDGQMMKKENSPLARALQGDTSHNTILPITCIDGSLKTILCSASPLKGLDEHIMGAVVVIQDLTESKKIEIDFEQRISKFISLGLELEHSLSEEFSAKED